MLLDEKVARTILALESFFEYVNKPKNLHDSLANMTGITEGAAEMLSTYKGKVLDLSGLKDLSQPAAAALGAYKGDLLLDGIEDLSPDILEEFSERSWKTTQYLGLGGLRTIDESQARALSSFQGKLGLNGLLEISDNCAKILGAGSCFHLYLDGLPSINGRTMINLLGRRGAISLDGIKELPALSADESSEDLEFTYLSEVHLNGLKSASADSLNKVVSAIDEYLYLNSLESLPQDGDLFKNCGCSMFLDGLKRLTDLDSVNLGVNLADCSLSLAGLEELSVRQAELLVGSERGDFCLGLRNVSDEVANAVFRSKSSTLVMNNLEELSPLAAKICGRYIYADSISFDGLKQISEEAFEILLTDYTGEEDWCAGNYGPAVYSLDGLTHITPRMLQALAKTKYNVSLAGVIEQKPHNEMQKDPDDYRTGKQSKP